jgi:hypothetical protein
MPRRGHRAEIGKEEIAMPFQCAICGEESMRICARCTKDTCGNHLCERCLRCSDCCDCEVALSEPVHEPVRTMLRHHAAAQEPPTPEPHPDEPNPEPDPWPAPGPEASEEPGEEAAP